MFIKPLASDFPNTAKLVGLFDANPSRLKAARELAGVNVPAYTDFDRMLAETNPDAVIVTTRDATHAEYVVRAIRAGCRAICEKALCTTAAQCREILKANKGAKVPSLVTHNMRYGAMISQAKKLLSEGAVGDILSMEFRENLDRNHGADYFRRWHRRKENSGGLLIHKASHHFDAMNYLCGAKPKTLIATGALQVYGKNGPFRSRRCMGCPHAKECEFYVDMFVNEKTKKLYLECEKDDGYIRDGCVFDLEVDIEDQAHVLYTYDNGVRVTYCLTAYASYEGYYLAIEGTQGRLEINEVHATPPREAAGATHGEEVALKSEMLLFTRKHGVRKIDPPKMSGSHGGADEALRKEFFERDWSLPPTPQMASIEEAVQAVLIGVAANESIAKGGKMIKDVQAMLRSR